MTRQDGTGGTVTDGICPNVAEDFIRSNCPVGAAGCSHGWSRSRRGASRSAQPVEKSRKDVFALKGRRTIQQPNPLRRPVPGDFLRPFRAGSLFHHLPLHHLPRVPLGLRPSLHPWLQAGAPSGLSDSRNTESAHCKTGRTTKFQLAFLFLLSLLAAPALGVDPVDRWYIVTLGGERSGYVHETIKADGDGNTVSSYKLVLEIRRDQQRLTIEQASSFVETPGGEPVSMRSSQSLGAEPVVLEASFKPDGVELVTRSGGREVRDSRPQIEGRWLPPAAAAEYVRQRLEAGAEEIVVRTIDPAGGLVPVTITRSNITKTEVEVIGKRVPAFRTTVRHSALPGIETTEYLDASGRAVRSAINLGPMSLEILASEREIALAELDPPELMQRTFVRPDRLIERPRAATAASFVLSVPDGGMPELPASGAQTVEPLEDGRVRVHVRTGRTTPAPEADDPAHLSASTMLDLTDPELIALHRRATRNLNEKQTDDPAARAEALRRFVYRYITDKSLGVGFATASEVARTRHGDCTEHSALLAALLRLDGTPSRVVSGLIYADSFAGSDDIFGFHMWVQAAIEVEGERRWLDLDPALPERAIFDATHIALATSTLRDDEPTNSMVALVPLMGRLEIEVETVEHAGRGR